MWVGLDMPSVSGKLAAAGGGAIPRVGSKHCSLERPAAPVTVGCSTFGRKVPKIATQRPIYWTMRRHVLDLNDFFYFVQVVDRGGFTAASRTLRTPKSTLSHRIQRLERNLGVRLINR